MPLPGFSYVRPARAEEAVALLGEHGEDARVLAGGQTLIPMMNLGLARPRLLVDIGRIDSLRGIGVEEGEIRIGALSRHREVETSPRLRESCPLLPAAASFIGHSHIRNRGTVGGSLAHADPAAEYPVALLALEAALDLQGVEGRRTVPAEEFFLAPFITALAPGEIVSAVRVPTYPGVGWSFRELTLRSGDFALACVAALLDLHDGRVRDVRLAVGGAGPVAARLTETETLLRGRRPAADLWRAAGAAAAEEVEPEGDVFAPAGYRREVTGVLVEEALAEAARRAGISS